MRRVGNFTLHGSRPAGDPASLNGKVTGSPAGMTTPC